jgi:NDP-sugar pyrophosphorylase family protein
MLKGGKNNMANIVTMAGKGKRFSDEGYTLPKPLIPINGEPMIWKVIDSLPESNKWIFVVREEHISEFQIDKAIKQKIPEAIITVDKDLLGGASIFCAEKYIDEDEEIFIAGCDMGFIYNKDKLDQLKQDEYSCILWTFTDDLRISENPEAWGYAILDEDNLTIKDMSVKIPISDNPTRDHVVAATFWVRSKKELYDAIRLMIKEEIKTNNEYYLDNLPLAMKKLNKKSCIFDVDLLIGWGTPKEFHEFEKINNFFKFGDWDNFDIRKKDKWTEYFENEK